MSTNSNIINIPNDPPSVDPTRVEFMTACMADGTDKEKCTAMWTASHQVNPEVTPPETAPGDVVDYMRKIEMLEAQIAVRDEQLSQTIGIAERAKDATKAKDQAEKLNLIPTIMRDSKFGKDELTKKPLQELQTIRTTLDKSMAQTFANVAANIDAAKHKTKNLFTAGYFDSATKEWKGGLP